MTFQESFVAEKIKIINDYLRQLKHLFRFSKEEILKDEEKIHIAERLCQLIVDSMIDVNQHFIKELDLELGDDLQGTFIILGQNKVLPEEFAEKIAPVVGLRNRIVHRYEKLDTELFIRTLMHDYGDFEEYIKFIDQYLDREK